MQKLEYNLQTPSVLRSVVVSHYTSNSCFCQCYNLCDHSNLLYQSHFSLKGQVDIKQLVSILTYMQKLQRSFNWSRWQKYSKANVS